MEPWHTKTSTPYQSEGGQLTQRPGILTTSSGNVQNYALDSKEGIENQDPFPPGGFSTKQESKPVLQFPIPKLKLSSNDDLTDNLQRLQARRQQHQRERGFRHPRVNPGRPYLQHPKYLHYRERPRCDTGPDGKAVWDDRLEIAFQNALVNIEPMGRRKKSQRGRPHGRNELISEWILQETGEYRTRKQVSSHIQVLNGLLKGIPEWDVLITATDGVDNSGRKYYSDSIERLVRSQSTTGSTAQYYQNPHQDSQTCGANSSGGPVDKHSLTRLSFLMWVSPPGQMEKALHIYSELPSNNATSVPRPLEHVKNWRVSFPPLRPVIDNWSAGECCDIILLEASFRLMGSFPPRSSKLGISLELDFLHPSKSNHDALAALDDWSCKTHMYQHGRLVKEVAHDDCGFAGVGKVKPFFESKWWASTFTQLTEKRKMAEDSKSDGAVELANEYSCNFFRGLTVTQEIFVGSGKRQNPQGIWMDHPPPQRRMAILLWKFSQAPSDYVGTTTWHRVMPHLQGIGKDNLVPHSDVVMSDLPMDSTMVGSHRDNTFNPNNNFMSAEDQQYHMFNTDTEDYVYHENFMDYKSDAMAAFEDSTYGFGSTQMNLDHNMNLNFDMPSHEIPQLSIPVDSSTTNFFELRHGITGVPDRKESIHTVSQHDSFTDSENPSSHQPLAKFDMNTHKMLQAQLGTDEDPFYTPKTQKSTEPTHMSPENHTSATQALSHFHLDEDDEALRSALLAASTINDNISSPSQPQPPPAYSQVIVSSETQNDPLYIPTSHPFTSPSTTLTIRPPLQTHHSFAGTTTTDHHHNHHNFSLTQSHTHNHTHSHSRNPSTQDFASVLADLQAFNANQDLSINLNFDFSTTDGHHDVDDVDDEGDEHGNLGIGMGITRPQSQPVLTAGAAYALYEEIMGTGGGGELGVGLGHVEEGTLEGEGVDNGGGPGRENKGSGEAGDEGRETEGEEGYVMLKKEESFDDGFIVVP